MDVERFALKFQSLLRDKTHRQSGISDDTPFFARSFLEVYQNSNLCEFEKRIKPIKEYGVTTYRIALGAYFAKSASMCLLDVPSSYIQQNSKTHLGNIISAPEACKHHGVAIELYAEEPWSGVEEYILISDLGEVLAHETRKTTSTQGADGKLVTRGGFKKNGF